MDIRRPYLQEGRLADIIALIQVLALDKRGHRGENGLREELNGKPKSAESWTNIAISHPEFFRADQTVEYGISLIARHVIDRNEKGVRDVPLELIKKLIEIAIELHDRQKERADRWKIWLPVIVVIVAGLINVIVTISTSDNRADKKDSCKIEASE
ncbi:hypothetical protein LRS05_16130 [Flavobacterium sp. J372]|uniref:hypothetical protein n=1 Tax=Flavobacterium sp. J372 TaxID=2898436 RepID=UPI0021517271|nr:hypothetical protein [Flavobacterium sp. J372]MCR5863553.1 hypothetical protein [Flavobacterium sp. J372]